MSAEVCQESGSESDQVRNTVADRSTDNGFSRLILCEQGEKATSINSNTLLMS